MCVYKYIPLKITYKMQQTRMKIIQFFLIIDISISDHKSLFHTHIYSAFLFISSKTYI